MVLVPVIIDNEKKDMYMDGILYTRLITKAVPDVQKKDNDGVYVVDGPEGSGKSVFAQQIAKILDPNFNITRVCMTAVDFQERIVNANKFECVVYDEAFTGLSSRAALSEVNKLLVSLMMEMRQKNLFVIIVLPTFYLLDKYVALFRAKGLFHIYKRNGKRGFWVYYNNIKKKLLYLNGKKLLEYEGKNIPRSNFRGRFTDFYTVNEQDYRKKKENSLLKKTRVTKIEQFKEQRDLLLWYLHTQYGHSYTNISKICKSIGIKLARRTINESIETLMNKMSEQDKLRQDVAKINGNLP